VEWLAWNLFSCVTALQTWCPHTTLKAFELKKCLHHISLKYPRNLVEQQHLLAQKSPVFESFFSRNCKRGEKTVHFWHRSFSQELPGKFSAVLVAEQATMLCSLP